MAFWVSSHFWEMSHFLDGIQMEFWAEFSCFTTKVREPDSVREACEGCRGGAEI